MIRFENVTKRLGSRLVLDGVTFEIADGETLVIVGPSGVGKSVTLKHMVRLLTPDSGRVWVGDVCVSEAEGLDLEEIRGRFGYLFQDGALLEWLSVLENVALPLREKTALDEQAILETSMDVLRRVGLEQDAAKFPSQISGGMRKRAGLARAIVRKPGIVLYDEPTSGLDPVTARAIDTLIHELQGQLGVTSVVVTHDLHSALSIGNRIAMLNGGRIVELTTPERFLESESEDVQAFLRSQFITRKGTWEKEQK